MNPGFRKTWAAATLAAVLIGLPCTAWYFAGSKSVRDQTRRIVEEPVRRAQAEAARLSQLLAARLETTRQTESRRPFYEYDPAKASQFAGCDIPGTRLSALAKGPADPLIWTHFQLDEVGQLTLPNLNPASENGTPTDTLQIFDELECAASQRILALRAQSSTAETEFVDTPAGLVTVGPFRWHTISVTGQPARVALREVTTRNAAISQGFVVLRDSMDEQLRGSEFGAATEPGEPAGPGEALLLLDGDPWVVRVNARRAIAAAEEEAAGLLRSFRLRFAAGTLLLALVGAALVGLVAQADRLAQSRVQFAASAAHELRTPLAGIRLHAEMLAEGTGDLDRVRRYSTRIADESARLGRVVTNVLGYSKMQRDGLAVQPQDGDLGGAVKEILQRVQPMLEAKGVRLESEIGDIAQPARFDRDALEQILLNLLDNAEKYSRDSDNRTIRVRVSNAVDGPTVEVIDHGNGVDPGIRNRLFRPFVRNPDTDAPAGLGIGLALVKALADGQHAQVRHADLEGRRTRFSVTFPSAA